MFDKMNYKLLHINELLGYCDEIKIFLQALDLEALPIKPLVDKFVFNQEEALAASNRSKSSQYTQWLQDKDHRRDESFIAFRNLMEASTHRNNESIAATADAICRIIRGHGWSLYAEGLKVQSAKMASLIKELNADNYQASIASLKANAWYKDMVDDNAAYTQMLEEKTSLEVREIDYDTENIYKSLRLSCDELFETISVLNRLAPDSKYTEIANFSNDCTHKYTTIVRSRKTKKEKADNEAAETEA
ncbi:DUF6261 family protein [Ancylomarina longa]|uniref:Uncharacterized protein n=1 Tax=Ancylomarina longa TaxID=2487017 RepID=A0A434AWE5_9BACT|nr:DUF6261 family protein [Ancylomarina longa]RUT78727.1 hypothetical protein DLK05_06190 [Ancylomarina longa]